MNEWWAAHKSVFRFAGHSLLLHCRSWWLVGDFTGRCPGMNSQPAKAKFGRGDQVPSLCAHDTVLVALSDVPCHTVRCSTSLDTRQPSPSVVRTVSVIWSPRCIFDRFVCWPLVSLNILTWLLGSSSPACSFSSISPPATALGRRKRPLTCHVSRTGGNAGAQGVPGQGKVWRSTNHQSTHPRRWVTAE